VIKVGYLRDELKKTVFRTSEENPLPLLPLSEVIRLKKEGKLPERFAWYVDDMALYLDLFNKERENEN